MTVRILRDRTARPIHGSSFPPAFWGLLPISHFAQPDYLAHVPEKFKGGPVKRVLLLIAVLLCMAVPSFAQQVIPWAPSGYDVYLDNSSNNCTELVWVEFSGGGGDYHYVDPYSILPVTSDGSGYAIVDGNVSSYAIVADAWIYPATGYYNTLSFDGTYNDNGLAVSHPSYGNRLISITIYNTSWQQIMGSGYYIPQFGTLAGMMDQFFPPGTYGSLPAEYHAYVWGEDVFYGVATYCLSGTCWTIQEN
jgi:hypothetical protein